MRYDRYLKMGGGQQQLFIEFRGVLKGGSLQNG